MNILGKHLSATLHLPQQGEDILLGINITEGKCECCGHPVKVTRIGAGVIELFLFLEDVRNK